MCIYNFCKLYILLLYIFIFIMNLCVWSSNILDYIDVYFYH